MLIEEYKKDDYSVFKHLEVENTYWCINYDYSPERLYFSVYGRFNASLHPDGFGGVETLADFSDKESAMTYAQELTEKHGLNPVQFSDCLVL